MLPVRDELRQPGYDPGFFDEGGDIVVPVPKVENDRLHEIPKDHGEPMVLKYHHFELVMNKTRHLQMWSAANVDYSPDRKRKGDRDSASSKLSASSIEAAATNVFGFSDSF